ncbi:MAG: hypothetical protein ACI909_001320 [Planctomycetota bacterium]|jgi:hypothetical protein
MRFETEKNEVNCIRVLDEKDSSKETLVATFDAHLDEVAPHIMASLSAAEQQQLMHWLNDRNVLREKSIKKIILCALPGLLDEASSAIDKLPAIPVELHKEISLAIGLFNDRLVANRDGISENEYNPELKHMTSSDVLPEILGILKKNL